MHPKIDIGIHLFLDTSYLRHPQHQAVQVLPNEFVTLV